MNWWKETTTFIFRLGQNYYNIFNTFLWSYIFFKFILLKACSNLLPECIPSIARSIYPQSLLHFNKTNKFTAQININYELCNGNIRRSLVSNYFDMIIFVIIIIIIVTRTSFLFSVIFVLAFSTAKAMLAGKGISRQVFLCVLPTEFDFLISLFYIIHGNVF